MKSLESGAQEIILDLDPAVPIDQESIRDLYLAPAVFAEAAITNRLHSFSLLDGLTSSPRRTCDSLPPAQIEHVRLRTSLMTMEKMRGSVGEALVRMCNLGAESGIEVDGVLSNHPRPPSLEGILVDTGHLSPSRPRDVPSLDPQGLQQVDCCCLHFVFKVVPLE